MRVRSSAGYPSTIHYSGRSATISRNETLRFKFVMGQWIQEDELENQGLVYAADAWSGVLPADLQSRMHELTPAQLVALRFASDQELADLVRDVLAGKHASQKSIKLAIKNWQGDYLRA